MIGNEEILTEIRASWNGVEKLRDRLKRSLFSSSGFSFGPTPFVLADAAHNLPFMHAMSILNDVLEALAIEGKINCKSRFLGSLIDAARNDLSWIDYYTICTAVTKRNAIAHDGEWFPRGECWKYIDAVKAELVAWQIII